MHQDLLNDLINSLTILPGVGKKSAQRMALYLLDKNKDGAGILAKNLEKAIDEIGRCARCRMLTSNNLCRVCSNTSRDKKSKRMCEINSRANTTFANNLDAIIAQGSSCENLIPLYRSNLDANRGDEKWLKRAAGRMDAKECSDDPLFVELVEALHSLKPSADSAYYLGILKDKAGDNQSALEFYEESLSLENDPYRKATIYYKIAVKFKKRGQKSQSRTYAKRALSNQPSMGKAHLLIASLYADSANECGNTQSEKRAVYWLAAQTVRRAATVDPSLKSTAQKLEASYTGRAPSKTDIFTEGKAGSEVVFNCWIRSKIKVPIL